MKTAQRTLLVILLTGIGFTALAAVDAPAVKVVDGVVMPKRPVHKAVKEAMDFLKKADGDYKPGNMQGDLAGYFNSAFVLEDGSRSDRILSFPGRQHAYFIFTFLRYYAYTGEREWVLRARDLAEWNLAHSTPANGVYSNVPYSTFSKGKPGGSRDGNSIEPDKSAFLGSGYIAVYEATGERKYLDAARTVASTLVKHQREDGSWPFRVVPETGEIRQEFGGAPVFFVEFFENLLRHDQNSTWQKAHDRSLKLMLARNIEKNLWGTYHEDIVLKPEDYLSAEPMSFTASYLFRHAKKHPEYIDMGRKVIARMEERLVYTKGHAAAPAPAVSEQAGYEHLMPGHTARYCLALARLFAATGDQEVRKKVLSGVNALTFMQSDAGLFRTYFASVHPKQAKATRPNWYSQHLYTVCHVLELLPILPEFAPNGENHILGGDVFLQGVAYDESQVKFTSLASANTVLKLRFKPKEVKAGNQKLPATKQPQGETPSWITGKEGIVTISHPAAEVTVR